MARQALFEGLIFDENDNIVEIGFVGQDACYVVDDAGFRRHILSETVDRQVLDQMRSMVDGNEDAISKQAASMMGQDDLFSHALIMNQLKNMDQQFEKLFEVGMPQEARAYLGMMGFKITIDVHGDVIDLHQPGITSGPEDE
ncbi:MAG: hypothetical protein CVU39_05230 [Chloroflexi bacterium HGW-Chloroflexi-10]|nr:MAG: hypothetical protein CVU39_05230 [Chloroflexi bacterium HGW-Chloroflexi-10]